MFFGQPNRLHHLQRLGQRGLAARGRERDQERFLDRAQEREERHANQDETPPTTMIAKTIRPPYISSDELAERDQDADAHLADGRRNRGHHADRRELHHVAGELEHHLRGALEHVEHRLALRADRREADAEEDREDHELQDVAARHRVDDRRRDQRHEHVPAGVRLDGLHAFERVHGHRRRAARRRPAGRS